MSKDDKIKLLITEELKSENAKEKYLDILNHRIDDNRKSMGRLFLVLLLTTLAFPLLLETKISEISIGPLKVIDSKIALGIIPTIFTFTYYKYLMIWFDIVDQKRTFKLLTSELFNIDLKSFLNERLEPFSITNSIDKHHSRGKMDSIGCLSLFFWIPTGFVLIFFPFFFEIYLIKKLFEILQLESIFDWLLFITPIMIGIFTLLMLIQVIRNDLKKDKART